MMSRERDKLTKYLGGIRDMTPPAGPDVRRRLQEGAHRAWTRRTSSASRSSPSSTRTPIPDLITVPIAGNDDAIRSVELITNAIADDDRRGAPRGAGARRGRGRRELHVQLRSRRRAGRGRGRAQAPPSSAPPPRQARGHRRPAQGHRGGWGSRRGRRRPPSVATPRLPNSSGSAAHRPRGRGACRSSIRQTPPAPAPAAFPTTIDADTTELRHDDRHGNVQPRRTSQELRQRTGAGMMDCKKALDETGGNIDQAVENLRASGASPRPRSAPAADEARA